MDKNFSSSDYCAHCGDKLKPWMKALKSGLCGWCMSEYEFIDKDVEAYEFGYVEEEEDYGD